MELFKIKHFSPRAPCQFNLGLRTGVKKRLVRCKKAGMLPHLTPGHTHPPPTISPLPLNRCCSIAVWSSECLPAQALCQSHPPQWPSLVLQMGLISDSQRQNARRSSPQHSVLRLPSGDTSPSLRSAPGNTRGIDDVFKTNSLHRRRRRSRMAKAQCGRN